MAPPDADVLPIGGPSGRFRRWSESLVTAFAPTHVFGCAFLTKEKLAHFPLTEYQEINRILIGRFRFAGALPSCVGAVSISSGSVVTDPGHPYSQGKALEEAVTADLVDENRGAVVLRAYSVTGPFVQRIHDYAFSNLLAQGLAGRPPIKVESRHEVWRRYTDVSESLNVCMNLLKPGGFRLVESGGPLVELQELAQLIGQELGVSVASRKEPEGEPSVYASDNSTWKRACDELHFQPSDLTGQLRKTLFGCNYSNQIHASSPRPRE